MLVAVRIAFLLRTPAWVQTWVRYGSISVSAGTFPLSKALMDSAKLLRLRQSEDWS
jgi:hypothetical protein